MNSLQDYSILDLLPISLKKDPFIIALAEAIEIQLNEAYQDAMKLTNFNDVDNLPEPLLDYLAYQRHVDFYENDLSIDQKRKLIKNATMWHRKKGTPWAVEEVVSVVFNNAEAKEWFDYEGKPFFFRVETDDTLKQSTDLDRLVKMIDATKNKRSHLENVTIKRTKEGTVFTGGVITEYKQITLNPIEFKMPDLYQELYSGGFITVWNDTNITEVSE